MWPFETTECFILIIFFVSCIWWCTLKCFLVCNWTLSVSVDIPYINIAVSIDCCKDRWMYRWPLHIVNIFLTTFKSKYWCRWKLVLWVPQLDSPVHWSWKHQLWHIAEPTLYTFILVHRLTGMQCNFCHWRTMTGEDSPVLLLLVDSAGVVWLVEVCLVDVVIFRADVKFVCFILRKLHGVDANVFLFVTLHLLIE